MRDSSHQSELEPSIAKVGDTMTTTRLRRIALGLAGAAVILAILVEVTNGDETSTALVRTIGGVLLAVAGVLTVTVCLIVVKQRHSPNYSRAALITLIAWLPVVIGLQIAINVALSTESPVSQFFASVLWITWIVWIFTSLTLFITWIVQAARRPPGPQDAVEGSHPVAASSGWYPDPAGSGRMRWFDGVVWRDEYGDAPTQ